MKADFTTEIKTFFEFPSDFFFFFAQGQNQCFGGAPS